MARFWMYLFYLMVGAFFIGCNKSKTSSRRVITNWHLVHMGMPYTEVVNLLGPPPQVFNEGASLILWYPSGLSERDLKQPGLQIVAHVVAITNGVVEHCYVPQQ
jgi:hypothetical protein